jgi:hypothetical protein
MGRKMEFIRQKGLSSINEYRKKGRIFNSAPRVKSKFLESLRRVRVNTGKRMARKWRAGNNPVFFLSFPPKSVPSPFNNNQLKSRRQSVSSLDETVVRNSRKNTSWKTMEVMPNTMTENIPP